MKSISLHPNPIFERENWQSLNGESGQKLQIFDRGKDFGVLQAIGFHTQNQCAVLH